MTRRAIGVSERPPLLQTIPLSLQHLFAMFGATVLVPILFHINPGHRPAVQRHRYAVVPLYL